MAEIVHMDNISAGDVETLENESNLGSWVQDKVRQWHDSQEANYHRKWDEYYRLWRGIWAAEDRTREDERSRLIAPALQQAVESSVADIEEATFGAGPMFDIRDDVADQNPADVALMRQRLQEEFSRRKVRKDVAEVLVNAAVYGTGVAEVVLERVLDTTPATEEILDGTMEAVGVKTTKRTVVKLRPIPAKNFVIDPVATSVEEALGVAVDEFVPAHTVQELQEQGVYRDVYVGDAPQDYNIEKDPELDHLIHDDKVRLVKYFGKVPTALLREAQNIEDPDAEVVDLLVEQESAVSEEPLYTEAIVVIANDGIVLKAEENPYMMQDRPIVAFAWDVTPGLFWGRGICEKGYNSQKALDAELRARIEALALTVHPMLAMDATRIPRGHTPQVKPGKMLLTNGRPSEVIEQFNFGNVSQITFAQAAELQKMVQQATGAIDAMELPGSLGSNNKTGAVSMALGPIIKRQKRTLVNFQEDFWVPFVEKAAWRYMQFDPENFPVEDFRFVPSATLGIMAREYETSQLVQLLQTVGDGSPLHGVLTEAVINTMNVSDREKLVQIVRDASAPDPAEQQRAQEAHEAQMRLQAAQVKAVDAQGNESNARAHNYKVEADLAPQELEIKRIDAITKNLQPGAEEDREFERRLKIADLKLREKEIDSRPKQTQKGE